MLTNALCSVDLASARIASGGVFVVAGDAAVLRRLPRGNWVGGTIRYFMTDEGGCQSAEQVFLTELPVDPARMKIRSYGEQELAEIVSDAPSNGFSFVVVPAGSPAHFAYAQRAPYYPGLFRRPIVGWISGVELSQLESDAPLAVDGRTGSVETDRAVVLHAALPAGRVAHVGMINLFAGDDGDAITFPAEGFTATDCFVNGKPHNFARYLVDCRADTRLPLVADYAGAQVNTSFQSVDLEKGVVRFYAPVFRGIEYRIAAPLSDYADAFSRAVEQAGIDSVFACNCILNYQYGELDGKRTGHVTGPITFGEIAYQLLNQTLVYLSIVDG